MTPERLAHIRAHFKNPPSATCSAELALELCDEVALLMGELDWANRKWEPKAAEPAEAPEPVVLDSDPTPPMHIPVVVIDDRPKKKGKK